MTVAYNVIQLTKYRKAKGEHVRLYADAYLVRLLEDFYADHMVKTTALRHITNSIVVDNILRFTQTKEDYLEDILPNKEWTPIFEEWLTRRGMILDLVSKDSFEPLILERLAS